jgi:hypothetical protein
MVDTLLVDLLAGLVQAVSAEAVASVEAVVVLVAAAHQEVGNESFK